MSRLGAPPGAVPTPTRRVTAADTAVWVTAAAGLLSLVAPVVAPVTAPVLVAGVLAVTGLAWSSFRRGVRNTVAGMLVVGGVAAVVAGARWSDIASAFAVMCGIFSFVAVVRLLELPMLRRGYHTATADGIRTGLRGGARTWPAAALTYLLAMALSFGAIPLAYRSVRAMDGASDQSGSAGLVCRSFITANLLTPLSPPLAVTLSLTGLSWVGFLPVALLLSVAAVALVPFGPRPLPRGTGTAASTRPGRVAEFGAMLLLVLAVLVGLELLWPISHAAATVLAVLLVVPVWDALTRGGTGLASRAVRLARDEAGSWREQFVLFGAGGFVVAAAYRWSTGGGVGRVLERLDLPPVVLLLTAAAAITLLALAGLYPMTSLIIAATVLTPVAGGSWPVLVATAVMTGTMAGFVLSPFSGLTLLVSALSGRSSTEIGLRFNAVFGVGLLVLGGGVVTLLAAVT